jgi:hypothetical protein
VGNRELAAGLTEGLIVNQSTAGQFSTLPWSFRLAESSGVSLRLISAGVFLACFLVFFAYQNLTGGMAGFRIDGRPFWSNPWGLLEFFVAGLCAWIPAYVVLVRRSAQRNLDALRPSLNPQLPGSEWLGPVSARYYRIAGAIGVGATLLVDVWFFSEVIDQHRPEARETWLAWSLVRDAFLGWFLWRAQAVALSVAIHFYRLADRGVAVQLLHPRALSSFASQGFRLAFLFLIGIAIGSPAAGLIPVEQMEMFSSNAPLLLAVTLFAAVLLYLSCAGARRAIVREKSAELDRVRTEIEHQQGIALSADDESKTVAASRLPGLLAYEARVENVREWPFGAFGLLRFLLYVAIPVGSWVASALVERLVTGALD